MAEEDQDVFNDAPDTSEGAEKEVPDTEQEESAEAATDEAEPEQEEGSEEQGEEDAEPPAADKSAKSKSDKMIPEHRHKAALADVNKKLAEANARISEMTKQPAPDHTKDPDGYARHVRLETSKAIVSSMFDDYNDKIEVFQQMAQANPSLNDIVANAENPAKMAYDLATEHQNIAELRSLKGSERWKKFEEWEKSQPKDGAEQVEGKPAGKKPRQIDLAAKVPNLNRNATAVKLGTAGASEDDGLWNGHHSVAS